MKKDDFAHGLAVGVLVTAVIFCLFVWQLNSQKGSLEQELKASEDENGILTESLELERQFSEYLRDVIRNNNYDEMKLSPNLAWTYYYINDGIVEIFYSKELGDCEAISYSWAYDLQAYYTADVRDGDYPIVLRCR